MRLKKMLMAAMLAACTIFAGCGGGGDQPAADAPKGDDASKAIVVGLDDEYPPMGFKDENNEIVGFDVDLAKEAAKRLGRPVEFKGIDWASKEAELKSGRVDILWNGLDITPERQENMLFSAPYMDNRQIVFVRHSDEPSPVTEEAGLAGLTVGTQAASTAEDYFAATPELTGKLKELKTYGDYISAFMDLENGRLDAIVCDEIVGRYYMSKHPEKIDALDVTVGPTSQFGIAFRKDDTALRDEVQEAFDEMVKDGEAKRISERWFGADLIKSK